MRIILLVFLVLLIVIGGFYAFNNFIYNQKQGPNPTPSLTQSGTENNVDTTYVKPISHASMILNFAGQTVYNDPVGGAEAFAGNPDPDIILISDIHGDHLNPDTIKAISKEDTIIIVPQAVADELPDGIAGTIRIMKNGDKINQNGVSIEAVPMYNFPVTADARHTKGRGNGYIIEADGKRFYVAGDTGATPEMKALSNIDVAFVPMNPPFTMTVEEAADAVLAFKPKVVHPYHYRGQGGLEDVSKFQQLVETGDSNIKVELLNFYPENN